MDEAIYWRCRREGGAFWLDGRAWLRFAGRDAVRFLNGQCTNDVRAWDGARSLCAAVVTAKGKLSADVYLAKDVGGGILLDGPAALGAALAARFERYIVADDVVVEPPGPGFRVTHAWGAAAGALRGDRAASPNDRIGRDGTDIFCAGPEHPVLGAWSCPPEVAEALRVEAGVPAWGHELDENVLPPEVGREERWISYSKGCYIGQEVISRIRSVGHVNRRLVGLVIEGAGMPPDGAGIEAAGEVVGRVTSAARSPSLEKVIALGFMRRQDATEGTRVSAGGLSARVATLPFVI